MLEEDPDELWEQLEDDSEVVDSPSGGHLILREQRQVLHYLRLIEHEMPKLVGAFRVRRCIGVLLTERQLIGSHLYLRHRLLR